MTNNFTSNQGTLRVITDAASTSSGTTKVAGLLEAPTEKPIATTNYTASSTYSFSHPRPKLRKIDKSETEALERLMEMLTYKRPEGSKAQRKFINRFLVPLGVGSDEKGNCYYHVPTPVGDAPAVLWSSHTDTVHGDSGKQKIVISDGLLKVSHGEKSNCLGADCTTGVWLMIEMIKAKVPGFYLFHTGEECGGIGSSHISRHSPELVRGMKAAIAFDRRATRSIITHQAGGRCCSDTFAASLSAALGGDYILDSGGSFTDTANYTDLIGECTNVSVGYFNEHTKSERQCVLTALDLRKRLLAFDESKLAFSREPGEQDDDFYCWDTGVAQSRRRGRNKRGYSSRDIIRGAKPFGWSREYDGLDEFDGLSRSASRSDYNFDRLLDLIEDNPEGVADYLETFGVDADSLEEHITSSFGLIVRR